MSDIFVITSTVSTLFGTGDRLAETLSTIESVRKRVDAKIYLLDSSVQDWDEKPVREAVDVFTRVSDTQVQNIIESGYGMPFIKSATEVYLMQIALDLMGSNAGRIYKISGRYRLNDDFFPHSGQNFTFLPAMGTGIPFDKCYTDGMLMTRLYSFPGEFRTYFANVLTQVSKYLWATYSKGGLTDIEHGLYKHINVDLCKFVRPIGVEGRIGHLSTEVRE